MNNKRIVLAAAWLAASGPRRRDRHVTKATVSWDALEELRAALEERGIDWRALRERLEARP